MNRNTEQRNTNSVITIVFSQILRHAASENPKNCFIYSQNFIRNWMSWSKINDFYKVIT